MSGQAGVPTSSRKVLGFCDVSRAHFHSPAKRLLFVRTLPEDQHVKSGIAKMLKAMYGSKDAATCWDEFSEHVVKELGFKSDVYNPCCAVITAKTGTHRAGDTAAISSC